MNSSAPKFTSGVANEDDLQSVVQLRVKAFGAREGVENLVPGIKNLDPYDTPGRIIVVKNTKSLEVVGAARLHRVEQESPTPLELRPMLEENRFIFVDRLVVDPDVRSEQVSALLFREIFLFCEREALSGAVCTCLGALLPYYQRLCLLQVPGLEDGIVIGNLRPEPYYPLFITAREWEAAIKQKRPRLYANVFENPPE